jgi:large subunit ribosomal protein L14
MLQMLSRLDVADNTGARQVQMIRRLGQITDTAGIGDVII